MISISYNSKRTPPVKEAKHCFIYRGSAMKKIKKDLGREHQNLCLKVFYDQDEEGNWGDEGKDNSYATTLDEATRIQNICWYYGLAPRIYQALKVEWTGEYTRGGGKIVKKGNKKICDAQVTDDLGDNMGTTEEAKEVYEKIIELGKEYGFKADRGEYKGADLIEGKFVDFQPFSWSEDYKQRLRDRYIEFGTYGKKYYHNVPELGLTGGPRDNENRVKWLGLDKIDFKEKAYIDLGCANGWFTRYVDMMGARSVCGIDTKQDAMKDPLLSAWLVANLAGQYNIQYKEIDIAKENNFYGEPFDIATFLSMTFHVGVPDWLNKVAKLVIVEDNSKKRDADKKLEQLFRKVEHKGFTEDRGGSHLPIYWCYK